AFAKETELKKRIWFTLGALVVYRLRAYIPASRNHPPVLEGTIKQEDRRALVVYRLGTYIPMPGIDPVVLEDIFKQNAGGILGMFDMLAGGALSRMTIFGLNIRRSE